MPMICEYITPRLEQAQFDETTLVPFVVSPNVLHFSRNNKTKQQSQCLQCLWSMLPRCFSENLKRFFSKQFGHSPPLLLSLWKTCSTRKHYGDATHCDWLGHTTVSSLKEGQKGSSSKKWCSWYRDMEITPAMYLPWRVKPWWCASTDGPLRPSFHPAPSTCLPGESGSDPGCLQAGSSTDDNSGHFKTKRKTVKRQGRGTRKIEAVAYGLSRNIIKACTLQPSVQQQRLYRAATRCCLVICPRDRRVHIVLVVFWIRLPETKANWNIVRSFFLFFCFSNVKQTQKRILLILSTSFYSEAAWLKLARYFYIARFRTILIVNPSNWMQPPVNITVRHSSLLTTLLHVFTLCRVVTTGYITILTKQLNEERDELDFFLSWRSN